MKLSKAHSTLISSKSGYWISFSVCPRILQENSLQLVAFGRAKCQSRDKWTGCT